MLPMEPLDVDVSANLPVPFELLDKQRQRYGMMLNWAAPVIGHTEGQWSHRERKDRSVA